MKVRVKQNSMELNEMTNNTRYSRGESRKNRIQSVLTTEDIFTIEKEIETAKEHDDDLDGLDHQGFAALHQTTKSNRIDAVHILLKNGAYVDVRTRDDSNTPLHIASRFGWLEVIKLLLKKGADPRKKNANGSTPLHLACRRSKLEVISLLLSQPNVDVNAKDKLKLTPLHHAAAQGSPNLCQILMDHGADVFAVTSHQTTPLHLAIVNGNDKCGGNAVANVLLPKIVAQKNKSIDDIIKSHDTDGNTLLHNCALTKSLDIAKKIIELGADVNSSNTKLGMTPLHMACAMGNLEMAKILVEMKADVQRKDFGYQTPLHKAAIFGHTHIIEYLLDNGAEVDPRDRKNRTPFLVAVASNRTNASTVKLLLDRGANINAHDTYLKTCKHLAIENQNIEIVNFLLEYDLALKNLNSPDVHERVPLHYAAMCDDVKCLKALLTKQARLNFQDADQKSALYLAAEQNRAEHVEVLGLAGSSVNERNEEEKTPLHVAALNGNWKVFKVLIKLGADINSHDNNGLTPLMCAAIGGCAKTCKTLLENNANMDDTSSDGDTALLMAIRYNNGSVVEMLMDLGADIQCHNFNGLGVVEMAGKWNALDAVKAVCRNKRWREVLEYNESPTGWYPMEVLISSFPEAATTILNKCIKKPDNMNPKHPDYTIEYDFALLDPGPNDQAFRKGNRYFGPLTMVEHNRLHLLLHPLTQALLKRKWDAFGSYIFYLSFFTYLVFLLSYMDFIITERKGLELLSGHGTYNTTMTEKMSDLYGASGTKYGIALLIFIFVTLQIAREVAQLIFQGREYFKDFVNLLDWMLYTSTTLFLIPYIAPDYLVDYAFRFIENPYSWWLAGLISIFLSFINFVMFLRRFNFFGVYISMFLEVLRSVVKVMFIFIELLLAFAIAFYILFKEQPSFNTFERSFLKTTAMTLGEMDFTATFIDSLDANNKRSPSNPYPQTGLFFCFLFILAIPIALMNLLVGLAIGDINEVRRNAELKRLARRVEFVSQIEEKYPRFITRMIYKPKILVKPNQKTLRKRLEDVGKFFVTSKSFTEEDMSEDEEIVSTTSNDFASKLEKNRRQIEALVAVIESQNKLFVSSNKLLTAVANRIDPTLLSEKLGDGLELNIGESNDEDK